LLGLDQESLLFNLKRVWVVKPVWRGVAPTDIDASPIGKFFAWALIFFEWEGIETT